MIYEMGLVLDLQVERVDGRTPGNRYCRILFDDVAGMFVVVKFWHTFQ